jgi:hypothetical protein
MSDFVVEFLAEDVLVEVVDDVKSCFCANVIVGVDTIRY